MKYIYSDKEIRSCNSLSNEEKQRIIELQKKYASIFIIENNDYIINARNIWYFLDKPRHKFATWIQYIINITNLQESKDYITRVVKLDSNNGGRPKVEHYLTYNALKVIIRFIYNKPVFDLYEYINLIEKTNNHMFEYLIIKDVREEIKFGNLLKKITGLNWETQYSIDNNKYFLDFYLPKNLIVEYDEEQHRYSQKEDDERIKYCLKWLHENEDSESDYYIPVIRVQKGDEINGLLRIIRHLIYTGKIDVSKWKFYASDIYDYEPTLISKLEIDKNTIVSRECA